MGRFQGLRRRWRRRQHLLQGTPTRGRQGKFLQQFALGPFAHQCSQGIEIGEKANAGLAQPLQGLQGHPLILEGDDLAAAGQCGRGFDVVGSSQDNAAGQGDGRIAGTGGLQMQLEPQSRGLLREHQSQLAAPHHTNGGDRWRGQGGWVWSVLHHGRAAISP